MDGSFLSTPCAEPAEFDYGVLPASVQRAVREQAESIQGLLAKSAVNVVQIGLRLQFVRDRLGRAHFQSWLKAEFAWSQPVASNYMRAARTFGELDCLARFQPGALFVLARRIVPAAARAEAVRFARSGERVTKAAAVAIVERHVPAKNGAAALMDRLRHSLLRVLPKLAPDDVERLAAELAETARRMRAGHRGACPTGLEET